MSPADDLSSPRRAADAALEATWMARDLCTVLKAALMSNGEGYGPPLLDALASVTQLAEDQANRAFKAAGAVCDHLRLT